MYKHIDKEYNIYSQLQISYFVQHDNDKDGTKSELLHRYIDFIIILEGKI